MKKLLLIIGIASLAYSCQSESNQKYYKIKFVGTDENCDTCKTTITRYTY